MSRDPQNQFRKAGLQPKTEQAPGMTAATIPEILLILFPSTAYCGQQWLA
jgi:hypothetical protein